MIAAIVIRWKQSRPDLRNDAAALRQGLLEFAAQVCELANLESITELTVKEMGWVLDALAGKPVRGIEPFLPAAGGNVSRGTFGRRESAGASHPSRPANMPGENSSAEVVHLASEAQIRTAEKLFAFLQWDEEKEREFLKKKFKGAQSVAILQFRQAHSLIRILLNIAVVKVFKRALGADTQVSRAMINSGIPDLRRRLGIEG